MIATIFTKISSDEMGFVCTVLCRFRNNINFIITICNKSINFGNAEWWAENNTYLDQRKDDAIYDGIIKIHGTSRKNWNE